MKTITFTELATADANRIKFHKPNDPESYFIYYKDCKSPLDLMLMHIYRWQWLLNNRGARLASGDYILKNKRILLPTWRKCSSKKLFRGMRLTNDTMRHLKEKGKIKLKKQNPFSSWALLHHQAMDFLESIPGKNQVVVVKTKVDDDILLNIPAISIMFNGGRDKSYLKFIDDKKLIKLGINPDFKYCFGSSMDEGEVLVLNKPEQLTLRLTETHIIEDEDY